MNYLIEYKKKYLKIFIDEYKNSNKKEKEELKNKIYSDPHLTERAKDNIWSTIIRACNK